MIKSIKAGTEVVVVTRNKVGAVAEVAKILAAAGINILAVSAQAAGGVGWINLVVGDTNRAVTLLLKKGYRIYENNAVFLEIDDKPGELKKVTDKLAARKIDLQHIYGSVTKTGSSCFLVISSNANREVIATLKKKK